jgi:hypothetical protein
MKIQTKLGILEMDDLRIKDIITEKDNARTIATEWSTKDDVIVRRDVAVSILVGLDLKAEQAKL